MAHRKRNNWNKIAEEEFMNMSRSWQRDWRELYDRTRE